MTTNDSGLGRSALTVAVQTAPARIPAVGVALSAAWAEWDTKNRFGRFDHALRLIREKLTQVTLNVDPHGEAGMQLLELVLEKAQSEHSKKKREYLANVLVSAWVSDKPPAQAFDEALLFLRATELFGDAHVAFLNKLSDAGLGEKVSFNELSQCIAPPVASIEERNRTALIILNHLCADFALVQRASASSGAVLINTGLSPEGIAMGCNHAILPRGQRFVQYVLRGFPTERDHPENPQ